MGDLKYKYAFDENGNIVSIEDLTKETSKQHTFKCIGCGNNLRPRAIGSKQRRAHFYHEKDVSCNGETYLHKLCKLYIKQYFDNSDRFNISYEVSKRCKKYKCKLRNYNCHKEHEINQINLKESYDTCTIETTIKGFVADLLLTNSKDPSIQPILIEICVTHPCETEKKESGLKIIEILIKTEKDIEELFKNKLLSENLNKKIGNLVKFISFERDIEENLISPISRFIYHPELSSNPFKNEIKCNIANSKIFKESIVELNLVRKKYNLLKNDYDIFYNWLANHIKLKRCNMCKFYYATMYEEYAFCRLSTKYGKPKFPEMNYAESCNSYHLKNDLLLVSENDDYKILEETNELANTKEIYRVIIAGSSGFKNYTIFEEKCNYYLSKKIKTHNIVILSGTSNITTNFINKYSYEHYIITVKFNAEWGKYGQNAGYISNEKMVNCADALIAFWDGKSKYTAKLIELAKSKKLQHVVVKI